MRPFQRRKECFMKIAVALAAVIAALAAPAIAAESLEIQGAQSAHDLLVAQAERIRAGSDVDLVVSAVGTGPAVLDVIEGRAEAAVVTESLYDAVADARITAWTERKRLLVVGPGHAFHPIAALSSGNRTLGFVTLQAPSARLARVIDYLNSEAAARPLVR
jgi:hypothetical protein